MHVVLAALLLLSGLPAAVNGDESAPANRGSSAPVTMARAKRLDILVPARRVVALAYHESLFSTAVALVPAGRPKLVDNGAFAPPKRRTRHPRSIVMASRGRGTAVTSAVDVVLRAGTPVLAPVSGVVIDTSPYRLYCRRVDRRVIIKPLGAPRMRVVVFHVRQVRVRPGDEVTAGRTRVGKPRDFGLTAQYDAYVRGHHPHVHVEVERRPTRPLPGCRR